MNIDGGLLCCCIQVFQRNRAEAGSVWKSVVYVGSGWQSWPVRAIE